MMLGASREGSADETQMEALVRCEMTRLLAESESSEEIICRGVDHGRQASQQRLARRLRKRRERKIDAFVFALRSEREKARFAEIAVLRAHVCDMIEVAKLDGLHLMNRVMHDRVSLIEMLSAISHLEHVAHTLEENYGRLVFSSKVTVPDEEIAEITGESLPRR